MSAHKLFPHLTSYSYVRCFQIAYDNRPMTSSHYMERTLLRRYCFYQIKQVLQLLNFATCTCMSSQLPYFLDMLFHLLYLFFSVFF
nr:unnamed protein product [Callosobruchus chinensis]